MCFGNVVITNWIRAVSQILVIVAIELRDVEYLLIVTLFINGQWVDRKSYPLSVNEHLMTR